MALLLALGFTVQLLAGRSSFAAPAVVHVHGIIFFGWAAISTLQAWFAATGRTDLHRPLGWLGAAWALAMIAAGVAVMLNAVGQARSPFFFQPQVFLIENLATLACFAALTATAIAMRHDSGWHRRLHLGALACLMGPGFGRLLPMPLLAPFAMEIAMLPGLAFPAWLAWREWREDGRLHPAWVPAIALLPAVTLLAWSLAHSPAGDALHAAAVAGQPGEALAGLSFPPPPGG